MNSRKTLSMLMLSAASLIWGTSFIAQILGMEYIGPFTFLAARYITALIVMVPVFIIAGRLNREASGSSALGWKAAIKGGCICGSALFVAAALQQYGLLFTTAGKGAFITAAYIVIVPVLGLFVRKIPSKLTIATIIMAMAGLYLLTVPEVKGVNAGDFLVLAGAVFWALHIMACGYFSERNDPIKLSTVQFAAVAVYSLFFACFAEAPEYKWIALSWKPILYAGIVCTGVAYTLQMAAQRYVSPVATCIILSGETLFGALAGWLVLSERLSARELTGCAVLLAATLFAQLYEIKSAEKS